MNHQRLGYEVSKEVCVFRQEPVGVVAGCGIVV